MQQKVQAGEYEISTSDEAEPKLVFMGNYSPLIKYRLIIVLAHLWITYASPWHCLSSVVYH